ncbi:IclR family transcriptional regulator [Halobacteriales archaeon QS_3_64_16]|nr:MAG: IclR family transcriptional regulator [Halobacteriales archaeon QS_3_64_16]
MTPQANDRHTLASVTKSLDVVEALWALDGAGVTELANRLEMSKSTVHNHLTTLERKGYVVAEAGTYRLGLRFLHFGEYVRRAQPLYEASESAVEELAAETGEKVFCMVEQNGLATAIRTGEGERSVETDIRVGTQSYMHCSAAGKAILAYLPDERVKAILDRWGLKRFTEGTITDRNELYEDLRAGREQGFFLNREEYQRGVTAIGAPVLGEEGVHGAIVVIGPAMRLRGDWSERELPNRLLAAANMAEISMSFS